MKRLRYLLNLLLVTIVLGGILFMIIYQNLNVSEEAAESDVIIVLEGENAERATRGVNLLLDGYSRSDKIIVSPYFETENFAVTEWYLNAGAQEDQLVYDMEATSTWTNATNSIELMEENGWESAIVVTSDYHLRRARLSFERASEGKALDFIYVASYPTIEDEMVDYQEYPPNQLNAAQEVFKYVGYVFYFYHFVDL